MGHAWQSYTAHYDKKLRVYVRVLLCARCETHRIQNIAPTGQVISSRYRYPEGYLFKDGRTITKEEIRLLGLGGTR